MTQGKTLIWGFYDQGNIGDDLMAAMVCELAEQAGGRPVILTRNPRFADMGYATTDSLQGLEVDRILLGGGAFFKTGGPAASAIERAIADLARFMTENGIPAFGVSIGSDGVDTLRDLSPARKSVVESPCFRGACVRLKADLALGLPNLAYLPDIVLCTKEATGQFARLRVIDPGPDAPETLINLSRRSALQIPRALWLARGQRAAFFRAHTGPSPTGGELVLPFFRDVNENSINKALGYLRRAPIICSSKLHPGVIAMSFGNRFVSISPRPKTLAFLRQNEGTGVSLAPYLAAISGFLNGG
ncbi:MAG: hypothetical protein IBX58_10535 [Roseovarius sp.]|nr:hypothetical protein [Roseovarius sp.]